ncbi:MAG: phage holin family protein [Pseudomonadota bacterium]
MFETLKKSRLLSHIALERVGVYLELIGIEIKLHGREIAMRMIGYAAAIFFAILAVIFIGVAIILTFWDSPYRTGAAWGVVALYVVVAGLGLFFSRRHTPSESTFSTLRNELKQDIELVKESI